MRVRQPFNRWAASMWEASSRDLALVDPAHLPTVQMARLRCRPAVIARTRGGATKPVNKNSAHPVHKGKAKIGRRELSL